MINTPILALIIPVLVFLLSGCASSGMPYGAFINEMHRKDKLTDSEYSVLNNKIGRGIEEISYKDWYEGISNVINNPQTSPKAKINLVALNKCIEPLKEKNPDDKITHRWLLKNCQEKEFLTKEHYLIEMAKVEAIDKKYYASQSYDAYKAAFSNMLKDKDLTDEARATIQKMLSYAEKKRVATIKSQHRRRVFLMSMAAGMQSFGDSLSESSSTSSSYRQPSTTNYYSTQPQITPNGTYVWGTPQIAPDGTYVGGTPQIAPDGTYIGGTPQIAPDGTYVGGTPQIAPDGTYVGGKPYIAPDGSYVGDGSTGW